jgi:rod shape-determining protein MreC
VATNRTTRRRAIALLALTSIALTTLSLRDAPVVGALRGTFLVVFRPFEGAVRVVTRPLSNAWYGVRNYGDVLDENEVLRERIAQQEGAAVAAAASVRLAQELLALNGLPTLAGISTVTAQAIGESPGNFSQTIEINQGSENGIRVGMPVLNAAGLVGKVASVSTDRAVVMLLTDPDFALAVKIVSQPPPGTTTTLPPADVPTASSVVAIEGETDVQPGVETTTTSSTTTTTSTIAGFTPSVTTLPPAPQGVSSITVPALGQLAVRETGVIEGRGPGRFPTVRFVSTDPRLGEVRVGTPIVTAGGSRSLAPPDIVIGTVSRVVARTGTAGPVLEVEPLADLSNLSFLRVLLYQPVTERTTP